MKRLATAFLILPILFAVLLFPAGCDGPDWKAIARSAITSTVGDMVISAIDQYGSDKTAVISWTMEKFNGWIEGQDSIKPYAGFINVEAIVEKAYDIIWTNLDDWLNRLTEAGMDTDAEAIEPAIWYINSNDFPGLFEEIPSMIG